LLIHYYAQEKKEMSRRRRSVGSNDDSSSSSSALSASASKEDEMGDEAAAVGVGGLQNLFDAREADIKQWRADLDRLLLRVTRGTADVRVFAVKCNPDNTLFILTPLAAAYHDDIAAALKQERDAALYHVRHWRYAFPPPSESAPSIQARYFTPEQDTVAIERELIPPLPRKPWLTICLFSGGACIALFCFYAIYFVFSSFT
jgi:hypothetical protein